MSSSSTPALPRITSLAAIIEGLKQGNALELQLFTQLQQGLEVVAAGLKREGYNRSDALNELSEKMGMMSLELSGPQKTKLADMINSLLEVEEEKKHTMERELKKTHQKINNAFKIDEEEHQKAGKRLKEHLITLLDSQSLVDSLVQINDPRTAEISRKWQDEMDKDSDVFGEDIDALDRAKKTMHTHKKDRMRQANCAFNAACADIECTIYNLKQIAKEMGMGSEFEDEW